jgi:hypothetical protein
MGVTTAGNREQGTGNSTPLARVTGTGVSGFGPYVNDVFSVRTARFHEVDHSSAPFGFEPREALDSGNIEGAPCSLFPVPCSLA